MTHIRLSEAQSYEQIGEPSRELRSVTDDPQGWQGSTVEDLAAQQTAHDFSFWNRRGNMQGLGAADDANFAEDFFGPLDSHLPINNWADPDTAASVAGEPLAQYAPPASGPFTGYSEDGIIAGATASAETPASPPYP